MGKLLIIDYLLSISLKSHIYGIYELFCINSGLKIIRAEPAIPIFFWAWA